MRILKKILLLLLVIFVIAQFFRPEKNNGDTASLNNFIIDTNPSDEVLSVLKETCFDCHSDFTRYPWYNNITPVNYWMADHVNHGKGKLNFSKWQGYSVNKKDHKLEEVVELVKIKEMPLPSYTWTHSEAKLSDDQIQKIVDWAEKVRLQYNLMPKPE